MVIMWMEAVIRIIIFKFLFFVDGAFEEPEFDKVITQTNSLLGVHFNAFFMQEIDEIAACKALFHGLLP